MRRRTRLSARLALTALTVVLAFVVAEGGLRLFRPVTYFQPPESALGDSWNQLVHQASSVPGLDYELRANLDRAALGVRIRTNSHGLRDRERSLAKGPNVIRIAALGDSFTFGHGVEGEQAWPSVLEGALNARAGSSLFEVINFGVEGYSASDEAIVLRHKAMAWHPDAVVLGYVCNDPEVDPIQPLHAYFHRPAWWQSSHVLRLIAQFRNSMRVRRYGPRYIDYLHRDPRKWNTVLGAFDSVRATAAAAGIPVVVAIFPVKAWIAEQVAAAAGDRGFTVVVLGPAFSRASNGGEVRLPNDAHPSALGHEIAAATILEALATIEPLRGAISAAEGQSRSSSADAARDAALSRRAP